MGIRTDNQYCYLLIHTIPDSYVYSDNHIHILTKIYNKITNTHTHTNIFCNKHFKVTLTSTILTVFVSSCIVSQML